jgi:fibronectin type 3 domain-containing protein/predicted small lipoprotein YifL
MNNRVSWFLVAYLLLALTTAVGCGRKTPPQVPDSPRPEMIHGIKAVTRDSVAFLSWPMPARNVEGRDITSADIQLFRIYRADIGRDRKKGRYKLYAEINMADPWPAEIRNNVVFWSDRNLKYGQVYGYQVRAVSVRGGVSPVSAEVRAEPLLSLAEPQGLTAEAYDSSVLLSWDTVTTRMDGSRFEGFVGYNLYRGTEKKHPDELPLNTEPLRTHSFKDTTVSNDTTYYYMVRSVDRPAQPWRESPDSGEVSATPRDMTPPSRPTGLTVVPGVGRAFLTWNENKERDLDGYYVYRSGRYGNNYRKLTEKAITLTTFSDETAKQGNVYYYMVTAVDKAGNESEGSVKKRALIEKLR